VELIQKLQERNIIVSGTYKKIKECCDENQNRHLKPRQN
jgi:hypothetical protein